MTQDQNSDWKYDPKFLKDLTEKVNGIEWGETISMEEVEAVLLAIDFKPHLLVSEEEKEKLSSKHDATIFFRDADKWKTLYEQLQTQLSQETKRREAAENLIEVSGKNFKASYYETTRQAYQVWQSLKSQHETVVEDGKEDKPTTVKEGDGGLNLTTTTI